MEFKDVLNNLLRSRNLTAYKLHKAVGIHQSMIAQWRKGEAKPRADSLMDLADYFHVSVDYLLGRTIRTEGSDNDVKPT